MCFPVQAVCYSSPMAVSFRTFVSSICPVCDWQGQSITNDEASEAGPECPQCYAPTRVMSVELLVPLVPNKNPLALALSRLGAAKGGKARAQRLSPARRREIARAAAAARWRRR
jgi:hypothetical protein